VATDSTRTSRTSKERAEFERNMDASFNEEETGQLIDAADAIVDLKAHR